MRFLLQSTTKGALFSPSVAVSLTAHLVFAGAAAYGSGPRTPMIQEHEAERVYYMPPPDRHPGSEQRAERIQYFDVGAGATVQGVASDHGTAAGQTRPKSPPMPGGAGGDDDRSVQATSHIRSTDSVYSILEVEESTARVQLSASPVYPPRLLHEGIEGAVTLHFVIDTTGRVDTATVEVLRTSDPEFTRAVHDALSGMLFSPAMVGGRRVRQLVEQRFDFHIFLPPPVIADQTRTVRAP